MMSRRSRGVGFVTISSIEEVEATKQQFDGYVISDRKSGISIGFEFVTYNSSEEVNSAIESIDGANHELPLTYDFLNYMLRSMDDEFRDIVGVR
ncbi:hypothetical protein S83_019825 [Arachis hypogaea]